jgi:general secretion pathway protein C
MLNSARSTRLAFWFGHLDAPRLVSVLLGVLIAVEIAMAAHGLRTEQARHVVEHLQPAPRPRHGVDTQVIVRAHLFGIYDPPTAQPIPEAAAALALEGTIATDDPAIGVAIISEAGRPKVYRVGELVQDASLHEVYLDHVTLSRVGVLTEMRLRKPLNRPGMTSRVVSRVAETTPTQANFTDNLGRFLGHPPPALDKVLRALDVRDGSGNMHGFRVFPAADGAPLAAMGLVPGDVIVAINGQPLTDLDKGRALLDQIEPSSGAEVTVERQNHRMEIALNPTAAPAVPN